MPDFVDMGHKRTFEVRQLKPSLLLERTPNDAKGRTRISNCPRCRRVNLTLTEMLLVSHVLAGSLVHQVFEERLHAAP